MGIILPSMDYEMHSSRTPEDAVMLLKTVTKQPRKKLLIPTSGEFYGTIQEREFRIQPVLQWNRNSFVPVFHGQIRPWKGGSIISMRLRMHPFVSGFCVIWLLGVSFGCMFGLLALLAGDLEAGIPFAAITTVMIAMEQVMTRLAFRYPAERSLQRLSDLLEETEEEESGIPKDSD